MTVECPKCQSENKDRARFCNDCATPLPRPEESIRTKTMETPSEEFLTGSTFAGRYQIIEELGKGGMGKVFRVLDKKLNEEIALKLIKPEIASDKKTIERFKNELKLARKIRHKSIGSMYELLEENGIHFITLEYVQGGDLKRFIRRSKQLTVPTVISIAKQVCEGLVEAHSHGIVHRDLKPSNIMIDDNGNARIMDFGIARTIKAKGITGAGVMIGTPEYMSPEQAEAKEVDHRSDIYSLGVILYEMITGQLPFAGDTPLSVAVMHKTETPKYPKNLNPQIPEELSRVILKCLEKDKEQRFQSVNKVLSELTAIEQGIYTIERKDTGRKPLTSKEITVSFSIKKLFFPAAFILTAVIILMLLWHPWAQEKTIPIPQDRPSIAVLYFQNNTRDQSWDNWRDMLPRLISSDLLQSKYLHVLTEERLYGILKRLDLLEADNYSTEDLEKIAHQTGVNYLINGSYITAGKKIIINTSLHRMDTVQLVNSFSEQGESEDSILSIVDIISRKIKSDLNLSREQIEDDIDAKAGIITTDSVEAYHYYSEGRKSHKRNDYSNAVFNYKKAVEIDSEFAIAYRYLATSCSSIGYYSKYNEYLQKALELKDRLSERERLQIEGKINERAGKHDEAIAGYLKILEHYPDDLITHHNLATSYRSKGEMDKAIEILNKSLFQYKTDILPTYQLLANIYKSQGEADKAREVLQIYVDNFGNHPSLHRDEAVLMRRQGKYDLALLEIDKALELDPNNFLWINEKAGIFVYQGDLEKAEEEYQKLLLETDPIIYSFGLNGKSRLFFAKGRFKDTKVMVLEGIKKAEEAAEKRWILRWLTFLSYIDYVSGNYEKALIEMDKTWNLANEIDFQHYKRSSMHIKGLIQLKLGAVEEARKAAGELKTIYEQDSSELPGDYFHLVGMIELDNQNYEQALENFEKALSLRQNNILFIDSLASANFRIEEFDKARDTYERISTQGPGAIIRDPTEYGDIYAKSFYMLGKTYEQLGDQAKAIENFEKFLDLWKNADPGVPEVEDAKKRMAGLKSE